MRFSRFAYLLRLRFAMLYDIAVEANEAALEELSRFKMIYYSYKEDFTPEAIQEIICFVSQRVTEETCKSFILKASSLVTEEKFDDLDHLITMREKTIKGLKRSKLINAKEFQHGKPFESPVMMSYRWNTIVRTVLAEIREGFENE